VIVALFALVQTESIPTHYERFFDVALKQLESGTTIVTLLLGAIAYLATKRLLELPAGSTRPGIFWVVLPSIFAIVALVIIQWSYARLQDSLLMDLPGDFGMWWQWARVVLLGSLVLSAIFLAISFVVFSRR
jgi:hypothetical protein